MSLAKGFKKYSIFALAGKTIPMIIEFNETFASFLDEFEVPENFVFSVDIPTEVQKILDDEIIVSDLGISLKSFKPLYKVTKNSENTSIIEDKTNCFHVDSHISPANNKKAFLLGLKTLLLLADKFEKQDITGVRFWYSFQTPELGRQFFKSIGLGDEDQPISDRLSFHTMREGEEIVEINNGEKSFWGILMIDI